MKPSAIAENGMVMVLLCVLGAACVLAGCRVTEPTRNVEPTGFLRDYSQLEKGKGPNDPQLMYINPNTRFVAYKKVMIDRVTIWRKPDTRVDEETEKDLQRMADYAHAALRRNLRRDYRLVTEPGPATMRLRVAITQARASNVVLDTISNVVPPAIAIGMATKLATGTESFVGHAEVEAELVDSLSNERLAAMVGRRAGGRTFEGKFDKWDDVKKAIDFWVLLFRNRLQELRAR